MSDTLKNCEYCGKEFKAQRSTAAFCSPACKLKFNRKKGIDGLIIDSPTIQASKLPPIKKKHVDAPLHPIEVQETLRDKRNTVNRPGGARRGDLDWPGSPDWFVYGTPENPNQTWDRVCVRCGKDYTTPLSLMRFCSDECKKEVFVVIANGPHPNYLKAMKN